MTAARFDLTGIGNAIVDLLVRTEDAFLVRHEMPKGGMTLIDADRAAALTAEMVAGTTASGGSVANSCAVAAALGARVAFLGKVAADELGAAFAREIAAEGVHYPTLPLQHGAPTARCLIFVTPDGQRTMNTYLGAGGEFALHDVDEGVIADSAITYLEGYLFDPPAAQLAFAEAVKMAKGAGRMTALSLSDPFCVDRHRDGFRRLIGDGIDILFANEAEMLSLYQTEDVGEAARMAAADVPVAVMTQGEYGSLVLRGPLNARRYRAVRTQVVDTTGAGDAYAAGFMTAYARGRSLDEAGQLASRAAGLAIGQIGARPPAAALRALLTGP